MKRRDAATDRAAAIAAGDSLKLKEGERFLIIANPLPDSMEISEALYDAALALGARPTIVVQGPKRQTDFADEAVLGALASRPDAVASISALKMGKDGAGIAKPYERSGSSYDHVFHLMLYGEKSTRSFWSPSITRDIFSRTVPIDYALLSRRCAALKEVLDAAVSARVVSPGGTDVVFSLAGRSAFCDDGDFGLPGRGGNLPAGEGFASPVGGSAEGRIVLDGSLSLDAEDIVLRSPVSLELRGGFVRGIEGGTEARALADTLAAAEEKARSMGSSGSLADGRGEEYARNARNLGEIGIGLNPQAVIGGNMLEDEKAIGTCHFAIGQNYDGDAPALIHLDGLVRSPTIRVSLADGGEVTVMEDGELAGRFSG